MTRRAAALVVAAVAIAACTGGSDDARPTSTTRPTPSTSIVDLSGVALPVVAGATTSTVIETGEARIVGTVTGPEGPAPGATVRIERLTAGGEVRTDVTTDGEGRFALEGVPGGRYRVRAFLPPTLAQTAPDVRFLADREEHRFDLRMEAHHGVHVLADVAPDVPTVGAPVNLVVRVVERQVDADGIVRAVGVAGARVRLTGLGAWTAPGQTTTTSTAPRQTTSSTSTSATAPPGSADLEARTDPAGNATFTLVCQRPGPPGLTAVVPVQTARPDPATPDATVVETTDRPFPLELPACVAPAPSTTTTGGTDTTTTTTEST